MGTPGISPVSLADTPPPGEIALLFKNSKTSLSTNNREDLISTSWPHFHNFLGWATLRQQVPSPNPTVQMSFGNSSGQGLAVRNHSLLPTCSRGSGHQGKLALRHQSPDESYWQRPCRGSLTDLSAPSRSQCLASLIRLPKKEACIWSQQVRLYPLTTNHMLNTYMRLLTTGHTLQKNKEQKTIESSLLFLSLTKYSRCRICSWVTYLGQIISLKSSCLSDPRHLGEVGVEMSGSRGESPTLQILPNTPTEIHTHTAQQHPCQPSGILLPNCLISWIALNPHWFKLMVQNENPTLRAKSCLVWFYLGRRVHWQPWQQGRGPQSGTKKRVGPLLPSKHRIPAPPAPQQEVEENRRIA